MTSCVCAPKWPPASSRGRLSSWQAERRRHRQGKLRRDTAAAISPSSCGLDRQERERELHRPLSFLLRHLLTSSISLSLSMSLSLAYAPPPNPALQGMPPKYVGGGWNDSGSPSICCLQCRTSTSGQSCKRETPLLWLSYKSRSKCQYCSIRTALILGTFSLKAGPQIFMLGPF